MNKVYPDSSLLQYVVFPNSLPTTSQAVILSVTEVFYHNFATLVWVQYSKMQDFVLLSWPPNRGHIFLWLGRDISELVCEASSHTPSPVSFSPRRQGRPAGRWGPQWGSVPSHNGSLCLCWAHVPPQSLARATGSRRPRPCGWEGPGFNWSHNIPSLVASVGRSLLLMWCKICEGPTPCCQTKPYHRMFWNHSNSHHYKHNN